MHIDMTVSGRIIPTQIRRHKRARRISLRLSAAHNAVVITLPMRASVEAGIRFMRSKSDWVLAHVKGDDSVAFADGIIVSLLGEPYRIVRKPGRGISHLQEGELRVYCKPEFVARRVRDFLKKYLHELCMQKAVPLAKQLGKTVRDVKIRDTKSRWGSCSRTGTLTFHWQLIFAPPQVLDYLIAHEAAHLKEMNHSARFWNIVEQLYPDYANARRWLKREGHSLHRYGS